MGPGGVKRGGAKQQGNVKGTWMSIIFYLLSFDTEPTYYKEHIYIYIYFIINYYIE